jgi:hypothetical protein
MEVKLDSGGARRCDARCYNAKGDDCHCVCGGKNHGVGHDVALKNVQEHGDEMAEAYESENPEHEVVIKTG